MVLVARFLGSPYPPPASHKAKSTRASLTKPAPSPPTSLWPTGLWPTPRYAGVDGGHSALRRRVTPSRTLITTVASLGGSFLARALQQWASTTRARPTARPSHRPRWRRRWSLQVRPERAQSNGTISLGARRPSTVTHASIRPATHASVRPATGCHSLVDIDGKVMGDPLEEAALRSIKWKYDPASGTCQPTEKAKVTWPTEFR